MIIGTRLLYFLSMQFSSMTICWLISRQFMGEDYCNMSLQSRLKDLSRLFGVLKVDNFCNCVDEDCCYFISSKVVSVVFSLGLNLFQFELLSDFRKFSIACSACAILEFFDCVALFRNGMFLLCVNVFPQYSNFDDYCSS